MDGKGQLMKLEAENVKETAASAELLRELMVDDARRGNWLILMHDEDEEAFIQIAFDDHPDGVDLEYREGASGKLYHCTRPVTRLEAENAVFDYFDGLETWKSRFTWEEEEGYGESSSRNGGSRLKGFFVVLVLGLLAWAVYAKKIPSGNAIGAVIVAFVLYVSYRSFCGGAKGQNAAAKTSDGDDGGIDWREDGGAREEPQMWNGWAILLGDCAVFEAREAADRLEAAGIRCRLEVLHEDKAFHRFGNGGMGTRMCVLVPPDEYERAKSVVNSQ